MCKRVNPSLFLSRVCKHADGDDQGLDCKQGLGICSWLLTVVPPYAIVLAFSVTWIVSCFREWPSLCLGMTAGD